MPENFGFGIQELIWDLPVTVVLQVQCPECELEWCFPCQAPWHHGITCKKFRTGDVLLKQWAQQKIRPQEYNAQRCPRCKVRSPSSLAFNCPLLGLPRWAGTRKVKPVWILLKQETVSGSGISWTVCMSRLAADRKLCQQPTTEIFTGWLLYIIYKCAQWSAKAEYEAGHIAILSRPCIDPWYNVAVYAVCLEICIVTSSADNIAVETSDV